MGSLSSSRIRMTLTIKVFKINSHVSRCQSTTETFLKQSSKSYFRFTSGSSPCIFCYAFTKLIKNILASFCQRDQ